MQSLRGKKRTPCEGAGQLPALLLDQRARYLQNLIARGAEQDLGVVAKQTRMHRLLLLAEVVLLCYLGLFLCLLATTSDVPGVPSSAPAEENVGYVDPGANDPASPLVPDGSYLLTPAEEAPETNKAPVNAYLLTMLVLAVGSSFGASVGWLLMTNARRRGALCCSLVDDDGVWLAVIPENPSFLGVFRL